MGLAVAGGLLVGAAPASAVVGGEITAAGATPWVVELVDAEDTFCTGSLIAPRLVLTAGHCLAVDGPFSAVVGRQQTGGPGGTEIRVVRGATYAKRRAVLPDGPITGGFVRRDVGLLELETPVTDRAPIALGGPEHASLLRPLSPLTMTGWGVRSSRSSTVASTAPRPLRSVTAPLRPASFCAGKLRSRALGVLCVGRLRRPVPGACYGDSGGPLYATAPTGPVQVGVTSAGPRDSCGRDTTIYVRVQSGPAREWIDAHVSSTGGLRGGRPIR